MSTDKLHNTDEVPTLNSVIRAGDESVIQTKRISYQIGNELDSNLGPSLSREIIQTLAERTSDSPPIALVECDHTEMEFDPDETLELMIDDIVDRHITALRKDIRTLLERAIAER